MAEIIAYNTILSATQKNRIETYLTLKYGLTLGHNYIADVNGITTIYNISGYGNDIAGIGKDLSNQDLKQLTSNSENIGALITGTIPNIGGSNTTVYDMSTYPNDIAGVGQDILGQAFDQRTSKNENSNSSVTISVADANIYNEEYLIWGNDNAFDSLNTTFEGVNSVRFGTV